MTSPNQFNEISSIQTPIAVQLNGKQRQQFHQALISAFPNLANLKQMISFEFDQNLDAIAIGDNYAEIVFKLITWAEAQGKIDKLLNAACEANSGNPLLDDFQQQMRTGQSQTAILQPQEATTELQHQSLSNYVTEIPTKQEEIFPIISKEIDYKRLKDFLEAKKFKEADQETKNILLASLGKNPNEKMGIEEIRGLSEIILIRIDDLWNDFSNQKFGFRVQRNIWQEIISPQKGLISRWLPFNNNEPTHNDQEKWFKFGRYVGWRNQTNNREEWNKYKNLNFTIDASKGCFPYFRNWWGSGYAKHHPKRCMALMEKISKFD
ncbi:MAG: GUN4 domain-containing protein [Rivularia sp. (in: Bacteria)]|nr:GUN4 domain-containing protein [Rivularia sp. MS3]